MSVTHPSRLREVEVQALDAARLEPLIGPDRMALYEDVAEATQAALARRAVWNVNSTATGGGVAEMLQTLLAYVRGAGIDARWLVIEGDPEFFAITKRIHNGIYGSPGDGGELGETERRHYEQVLRRNEEELLALVRPGDVVVLHDPQPAGLAEALRRAGARVVWRCHIGRDEPNEWTERAWEFLRPYLDEVEGYVVSRETFTPPFADPARVAMIPPSIDPFSAKNEPLSRRNVRQALGYVGLLAGGGEAPAAPFTRRDGSPGRINRHVDLLQSGPAAPPDAPLVVQVSRWDRMKDMPGVMQGFAEHVDRSLGAHLVLAGPSVTGVADDPEGAEVLEECIELWRSLPHAARGRVHLACTPMTDPDEAAAIVNALQRHATVVVQKSVAEGFGLTVAEAMWKARPVVASRIGGIQDQIEDGVNGVLLDDPDRAAEIGEAARERVKDRFLGNESLLHYLALIEPLTR